MFHITHFFWRATFLEALLFQKMLPSIAVTLQEELLFLKDTFSEELLFYSNASCP